MDDDIYKMQILNKLNNNEILILEREEDIKQIYNDVLCVKDIFTDLRNMVVEQNSPITQIETNIEKSVEKTKDAVEIIIQAEQYNGKWLNKKTKFILLSIAGLTINAPITIAFGVKAGIISGLSTIGISAITSLF